jgi:hypothetical protein
VNFGFDLHGVVNTYSELFKELGSCLINNGHSVYIISGATRGKILEDLEALDYNEYTHLFSIQDYLNQNYFFMNEGINYNDGNYIYNDDLWDSIKGEFCRKEKIDLHIDDWNEYGNYFTTPFLHLRS